MLFRHQQWEDGIEHPTSEDLAFYCRVCGPNRFFESDSHLQNHIDAMHDRLVRQLRNVIYRIYYTRRWPNRLSLEITSFVDIGSFHIVLGVLWHYEPTPLCPHTYVE